MNRRTAAALALAALALAGCHRTPANFGPLPVVDVPPGVNGSLVPQLEAGLWVAVDPTPACRWQTTNPAASGTTHVVTLTAGQTFEAHGCRWVWVNGGQGRP